MTRVVFATQRPRPTGPGAPGENRPPSRGQGALWLLERMAPEAGAYRIAAAGRVVAGLDRAALARALAAVVERHDALRTVFPKVAGEPVRRVLGRVEVPVEVVDATAWSAPELDRRLSDSAHRPFDLERGPLLRVTLFRRAAGEDRLVFVVHHLVADLWSLAVVLGELGELLAGRPAGEEAASYEEFVEGQEAYLANERSAADWEWWRQCLDGRPPALDLPPDRPRPPTQSFRGGARRLRIPAGTWSRLRRLGRRRKAPPLVVLLAAFDALLLRHTGQDDLVVGTPTAGRRSGRLSSVVGYCVNPVPVRVGLAGDPPFDEAIDRVREAALGAFEHQDLPFPVLVERLERGHGGERDPSRSPLFQVMLGLQRARLGVDAGMAGFALGVPGATLRLGPLELESVALAPRGSQFDLTVMTGEVDGALHGTLTYAAELFDATTVERWARQLERLLESVAVDPQRRLSELPLLSAAERAQLLVEWNDTESLPADGRPATLSEAFERAAAATPDAVALVAGERSLSYGALTARAGRLAAELRALGVGPEARVAVLLRRREELVVALLGVLGAGGAYVPLDPAYPAERLGFMLADSGAVAMVTEPELASRVEIGVLDRRPRTLDPEGRPLGSEDAPAGNATAPAPRAGTAGPGNLAYLIYTSGSTGRPKAVAIEHRSALALVRWSEGLFGARELSGVLAATSVCFDLSVFELFVPLCRGGRIFLVDDALGLADLGPAAAVTLVNTVPSAMEELVRLGWLPPSVETVNLAGEPLRRSLADAVYRRSGVSRVLDLYGPSEDTTYSTGAVCERPAAPGDEAPGEPAIGRPITRTTAYLVRDLRPVPLGAAGELLLGGAGLARGYLGRPALTAERFVPDPFGAARGEPGGRLYRTGDLVRRDRWGELQYLGRLDHQVKVRGYRVEPGEIEALLARRPEVRETVVVARRSAGEAGLRLIAYAALSGEDGAEDAAEACRRLRRYLESQLPAPLVPSAVVVLDALPRTPNGKIDRRALPEPDWSAQAGERSAPVAPRNALEAALAAIFRDVLGLERVGVEDGFFELGGHSLLVARVIAEVQERIGFELALPLVFENPSIAELASAIEASGGFVAPGEPAVGPHEDDEDGDRHVAALSFAQERLWILAQLDPRSRAYHLPGGVRMAGRLHVPAFAAAIAGVTARHEALRTVFRSTPAGPVQEVRPADWLPLRRLPMVDLSGLAGPRREAAADGVSRYEAERAFSLREGPLVRATLIRLSGAEHRAVVCMHHIVADGWSVEVFVRELSELYAAAVEERPAALPELPVQYRRIARRQRRRLETGGLDRLASWWREELAGAPASLDLPVDRPRPARRSGRAAELHRSCSAPLRAEVARLARELDATPFMVWLAALGALLGRLTGHDEVVVGSPTAGRHEAESEGLIGFFVNTIPVRVELSGDPTFRELVARVRARALGAYAHQDLPFERLVEAAAPPHDPSVTPVFQVLFVLQNVPPERFELAGITLERLDLPSPAAKFDLTVELRELEGEELAARFEADADLFDLATIDRWADELEALAAAAVAEPGRRLSDLTASVPSERTAAPAPSRPRIGAARRERSAEPQRARYVEPRDTVERTLAAIFRDLLGVEKIGADDRFFALGGHSLLAARLLAEIRERLGHELPLSAVFERPTVAGLATLLRERGADPTGPAGPAEAVPRGPGDGPWPLSFAQERLWFLEQLEPGKPTYNMPAAVALRGRLDGAAMASAVAALVRRHEVLRTVIERTDEGPVQRVRPAPQSGAGAALGLAFVDLEGLPPGRRRAVAHGLARREARRPFDLERGPLFRARLLRLSAGEHLFTLDVHHVVCDGWSLGVFVRELAALYEAALEGRSDPLPLPPIRYGDFAAWQRRRLAGERLEELVAWWRRELEGLPELSELPLDRPRPAAPTRAGAVHRRTLPAALAEPFAALARERGATPFMALFAAFQTLVHRHSGATDLALGAPVAGRSRPETAGVIGLFVDTVVLRSDLADDPSFLDLLERSRGRAAAAFAHQSLPFDRLVNELAPRRPGAVPPIFQVMLALQNAPLGPLALPEVTMEPVEVETGSAKFDLAASFRPVDGALEGTWAYSAELFDESTIARFARRFETLVQGVVDAPGRRLSELPLLSAPERHQVHVEWRTSSESYPVGGAVHRMLAERAEAAPDAVALVLEGSVVSLGELRRRWLAVAGRLRAEGVGPGSLVALFLDRSFDLVAGLVGVLEAGAAYVPIDPTYPRDRIAFMLADSGARAVVTQESLVRALPSHEEGGPRAVVLGGARPPAPPAPPRAAAEVVAEQAAYVIYTSGSTGRPKGVVVPHGSLANRIAFHASEMAPGDRYLARTTISFDVAILQLVAPLLAGGGAVLVPPSLEQDPAALARLVDQGRATHMSVPPSLLAQLLAEPAFTRLRCLRHVISGGEVVPPALAEEFTAVFDVPLVNRYGPTELTLSITSWTCPPDVREPVLPIGRPIARAEVYLLDRSLRPVPIGVSGELYGGGAPVARGYLGRPAATAAAFLPDPFSGVRGARLYGTGDLARWRADGEIDFVGRRDEQVKVRGYRIELGEVEAVLGRCPAVGEAVVAARPEPGTGTRQLVAYLVRAADAGSPGETVTAARAFLGARLPAYMVPSSFSILDELPLTPSGKVDRRALPEPDWQGGEAAPYRSPRTPTEELIASLYAAVLGTDAERPVGIGDDFFDLGGHSLLATRLISRLRQTFEIELPIRALFEHPTVEALAAVVEATACDGEPPPPLVPIRRPEPPPGAEPPSFAPSFAQERLWFLAQLDPGSPAYHLPGVLRMHGWLDAPALATAVLGVTRRHEALRTVFRTRGDGPVQVVRPAGWAPLRRLPVVDLSGVAEEDRQTVAAAVVRTETARPFDLERGPLLRVTLLRLDPEEHVLVVNTHHIVSDGWSVGVFVREVPSLYAAAAERGTADLPALPVQYVDYAAWQREWLDGASLDRIAGWWAGELAGAPDTLELPTDRPRPPVQTFRGDDVRRRYFEPVAAGVARLARELAATPFMVWLAAVGVLLGRLAGQDDLVLGSPIAGRDRMETEGLIGFFVNTLALRLDLGGEPSFRELVGRVRQRALGAYAHQDLPFERLVEAIAPRRDLATTPIFQVLFVLQNVPRERIELPGLALDPVETPVPAAKFDLTIDLAERDDGSISARFERNRDLFDAATVRRWAAGLEALVTAAVAEPDRRISALSPLTPVERHALLVEWSRAPEARAAAAEEGSLAMRLRRAAQARPDAVALVAGPRSLTYGALARRVDGMAWRLRAAGVGPEARVGVCAGRSIELVIALLGVLEAGGAYVPLDPGYPAERVRFMLEDSGARVVLADADAVEALGLDDAPEDRVVLPLAGGRAEPQGGVPDEWPPAAGADNLAYVIYTSGSTGRPKGVSISHGAAGALVTWSESVYGPDDLDGVLAVTSVCFDLSVFELFVPLLRGGRVILAADALAVGEDQEAGWAVLLNTVPSVLSQVLALGGVPESVRVVNLAGEPLQRSLVSALERARPGLERVFDLYGPSEDTTYSTFARAGGAAWTDGRTRPDAGSGAREEPRIGRPIAGTRAYVLDRAGRPVPAGAPGELYLAGKGLARGYLGRPGRTAGSFLPDPFAESPGERAYRTGDLVRWGVDGRLEYLGRLDHQVKLRGFRVELGEVEAALLAQPEVREAAVVAPGAGSAGATLIAFAVAPDDEGLAERLRAALRRRLPGYAVPDVVRIVRELPLTPSGKVDRRALAAGEVDGPSQAPASAPPETAVEIALAEIFAEVLGREGIEGIGIEDDFFDLGGHSLKATQVLLRVNEGFGVRVPVRRFFEEPTIAGLAVAVAEELFADEDLDEQALAGLVTGEE